MFQELGEPLRKFNRYVNTLCFPNQEGFKARNLDAIVVGWGKDEAGEYGSTLRKANVTILPPIRCKRKLESFEGFRDVLYCANDKSESQGGVCQGDSGNQIMVSKG